MLAAALPSPSIFARHFTVVEVMLSGQLSLASAHSLSMMQEVMHVSQVEWLNGWHELQLITPLF